MFLGSRGAWRSVPPLGTKGKLLSVPVSLLAMASMNSALLPTTFARGILVTLCYLLLALFVVVVLAVIFGGLFLVGFLLR